MSTILAMDTSGPSLSVALLVGERLAYECTMQNGLTHSERLMKLVDQALAAEGIGPDDVDCFAAVNGPGSFTGVRLGVATAKSLAHATEKPCLGVNALEALAEGAVLFDGVVCPMRDARAGQVYAAAFVKKARVLPDEALRLDALLALLAPMGRCCFLGDGAAKHRETIAQALGDQAIWGDIPLRASCAARLAQRRAAEAGSWRLLAPYYLRLPQAERERAQREALHD